MLSSRSKVLGGKITVLLKIILNNATSDCSFFNLRPIFAMLGILASNDLVDISHDFGCYGNHFGGTLCVTIVTKIRIFINWLSKAQSRVRHCMIHHWQAGVLLILMGNWQLEMW